MHFPIRLPAHPQQAIELIEKEDTDLNAGDKSGMTPIHMACYKASVSEIVEPRQGHHTVPHRTVKSEYSYNVSKKPHKLPSRKRLM